MRAVKWWWGVIGALTALVGGSIYGALWSFGGYDPVALVLGFLLSIPILLGILWGAYLTFREAKNAWIEAQRKVDRYENPAKVGRHISERIAYAKDFPLWLDDRMPKPSDQAANAAWQMWLQELHEFLRCAFSMKEAREFQNASGTVGFERRETVPSRREAMRRMVAQLDNVYDRFQKGELQSDPMYDVPTEPASHYFYERIHVEYRNGRYIQEKVLAAQSSSNLDERRKWRDQAKEWHERLYFILGVAPTYWAEELAKQFDDTVFDDHLRDFAFDPERDYGTLVRAVVDRIKWLEEIFGERAELLGDNGPLSVAEVAAKADQGSVTQ